jgi:Fe-S-cluster containining protein
MSDLKKQLTLIIREEYQKWFSSRNIPVKCTKGCAACCSVNVKISSIEGELIYDFIKEQSREKWFASLLNTVQAGEKVTQTTNDFAGDCLAGKGNGTVEPPGTGSCLFLEDKMCSIYAVRPFSCRCFVSTVPCEETSTAEVDQIILTASTVIMQLLEHVGQKEYWGNLQDVLLALSDLPVYKTVRQYLAGRTLEMQARARVLSGQPIPGFMLDEKEYNTIMVLLEKIFNRTVDGRRIEDILNGK